MSRCGDRDAAGTVAVDGEAGAAAQQRVPGRLPGGGGAGQSGAEGGRPKTAKLAGTARLRECVQGKLELRWSPEQISVMLEREFPDDREMRVSHEAIYQSI